MIGYDIFQGLITGLADNFEELGFQIISVQLGIDIDDGSDPDKGEEPQPWFISCRGIVNDEEQTIQFTGTTLKVVFDTMHSVKKGALLMGLPAFHAKIKNASTGERFPVEETGDFGEPDNDTDES
jgi:hypothetical protein